MTKISGTAQPGHPIPIEGPESTDFIRVNYGLGIRRPVVVMGDVTSYTVKSTQTGSLFTYGGNSCGGITITLPTPAPGLWYEFAATGVINSAATIVTCASTDAFIVAGTSAGVGTIQPQATTAEFTKGGLYLEFFGMSTSRYLVRQVAGSATAASTESFKGAS